MYRVFRGKTINTGKWVTGYLCYSQNPKVASILDPLSGKMYLVHLQSIGQHTDRRDSTGKLIFDGDILEAIEDSTIKGVIIWDARQFAFVVKQMPEDLVKEPRESVDFTKTPVIDFNEYTWKIIGDVWNLALEDYNFLSLYSTVAIPTSLLYKCYWFGARVYQPTIARDRSCFEMGLPVPIGSIRHKDWLRSSTDNWKLISGGYGKHNRNIYPETIRQGLFIEGDRYALKLYVFEGDIVSFKEDHDLQGIITYKKELLRYVVETTKECREHYPIVQPYYSLFSTSQAGVLRYNASTHMSRFLKRYKNAEFPWTVIGMDSCPNLRFLFKSQRATRVKCPSLTFNEREYRGNASCARDVSELASMRSINEDQRSSASDKVLPFV